MKKIVLMLLILFIFLLNNTPLNISADFFKFEDEDVIISFDNNTDNVQIISSSIFLINQNNNISLMLNDNKIYVGKGNFCDYTLINQNLYLLVVNEGSTNLYNINLETEKVLSTIFKDIKFNKITNNDNKIYIVGTSNNNACIYMLDSKLNLIDDFYFGGDGFETINHLLINGDYLYISIYKDALSNNGEFISTGNLGEKKSIIVKLDFNMSIIDVLYLNEIGDNEIITDFIIQDQNIKFLLKSNNYYYYYDVSTDLTINNYSIINKSKKYHLLPNYKSDINILLLTNENDDIYLSSYNNTSETIEYFFNEKGEINDYKVINGELYISVKDLDGIKIIKYGEYEIVKNNPKYINKLNYDLNDNSNVKVESYFEKINLVMKSTSPYLQNMISGIYYVQYEGIRLNGDIIQVSNQMIIKEFTNFVDGGIYQKGKELLFFGTATIDGVPLYNGTKVETLGMHEIIITNVNGQTFNYNIYIVEDYPFSELSYNIPCEVSTNNEKYCLSIDLNNVLDIKRIIINELEYSDYEVDGLQLKIYFTLKEGINSFKIDYLEYLENDRLKKVDIDQLIDIIYDKKDPTILVNKTIDEKKLLTRFEIEDIDNSFMYILIKNNQEEIIYNNSNLNFSGATEIYFVYNSFNQTTMKKIIEINIEQQFEVEINFLHNEQTSKTIEFNITMPKDYKKISKLEVNNIDLKNYYTHYEKHNFLSTIIYITIIFSTIFIIVLGIKKYITSKKI